ncbi:MAG: helix-turn-helix domain-containing protein [Ruminococcaceae bacterium]|nr:helix-turn-helix domain-containing protein [Oscillospiraceae bacterium]
MELPTINTSLDALSSLPIAVSTDCFRHTNALHFHDYTQICHVLSGTLRHEIDGNVYLQRPGSGAVILPYTRHCIDTTESQDTPIVTYIRFYEDFMLSRGYRYFSTSAKHARFEEHSIPFFREFTADDATQANTIIRKMSEEFSRKKKMSYDCLAELLASYFRIYCTESAIGDIALVKERADAITRSIKYISDHLCEKLTIDELSLVAGMSRSLYTQNFKLVTGMTVANFIHSARMQKAQMLIRFSEKTLDEIAVETGMYDKSHLSNSFYEHFGIHAREQRRKTSLDITAHEEHASYQRRWKFLKEQPTPSPDKSK